MESLFDSFTPAARQALYLAVQPSVGPQSATAQPEHLLLGILNLRDNVVLKALAELRLDLGHLMHTLVPEGSSLVDAGAPNRELGAELKQAIRYAFKEAEHLGHRQVDVLHLLTGLLYEGRGKTYDLLAEQGVSLYELRQQLLQQPHNAVLGQRPRTERLHKLVRPSPVFLLLVAVMAASGGTLFFGAPDALVFPLTLVFVISGWVASVCVHEFGHAVVAYLGGDHSVKDKGYLTLNPLRYTHPVVSILFPLLFLLMGGIGLPGGAVYIDRSALRSSRWEALVSAAGPLGTLAFTGLVLWPFWLDWSTWVTPANVDFWSALAYLGFTQVTALIFNLLPIPPLDGFGILEHLLPYQVRERAYELGNILLLLLFFALQGDNPLADAFWTQVLTAAERARLPIELVFDVMDLLLF